MGLFCFSWPISQGLNCRTVQERNYPRYSHSLTMKERGDEVIHSAVKMTFILMIRMKKKVTIQPIVN